MSKVKGVYSRLYDAIVNMIINAVHAMPRGGILAIATESDQNGVRLRVSDTGIGMTREIQSRIFEPFFTTKMSVGSGMGLATAYATIVRWGGKIDVESEPDKGATFTVWLPPWEDPDTPQDPTLDGDAEIVECRLLFLDDDEQIGAVLPRVFPDTVQLDVFSRVEEALDAFEPGVYDAAIIDLGLPDIPGHEVAQRFKQADASLVTILATGWEIDESDPRRRPFDLQIQKPLSDIKRISQVIAQALTLKQERDAL